MAFATNLKSNLILNQYINGLPSGVDNRHGNIRDGGTISDATNWSSSSLGEGNPVTTITSGVGPVEGAVPGNFNQGTQVINAIQTGIAGNSNTTLLGAQSNSANEAYTPAQVDIVRTYYYKTAVVAGNWNVFDGTFSAISNAASGIYDITRVGDTAGNMRVSGTDVAANTTQDAPGKLTYRNGSPDPVNGSYGARYNW